MTKQISQLIIAAISLILAQNIWSERMIYKCKNQEGAYIYQKSACGGSADTISSWTSKETVKPVVDESAKDEKSAEKKEKPVVLKLKQNSSGHYATDGSINDKPLNFVVDTGASLVSLPEQVAHSALIYCDDKIQVNTANGMADSCTAKIKTLKFGPFIIQDVIAVIQPNLGQPLLGMNILQMFKIEQNSGEMQISVLEKSKSEAN